MRPQTERRASPPAPPAPTRKLVQAQAAWAEELRRRLAKERGSMMWGLVLLVLLVLVVSGTRAGLGRMFVAYWWRQW